MLKTKIYKVASADTTTGAVVGKSVYVGGARRVGVLLRLGSHTSGNTVFTFAGGMEEGFAGANDTATPTMTALNVMLDNVANTNAQNLTRIASKTLNTNGDYLLWLDPSVVLQWFAVNYNTTTDGAVTVFILVQEQEA
jgi:hypothetical protein